MHNFFLKIVKFTKNDIEKISFVAEKYRHFFISVKRKSEMSLQQTIPYWTGGEEKKYDHGIFFFHKNKRFDFISLWKKNIASVRHHFFSFTSGTEILQKH